jgi:NADPH-dependent curcumin reductase CurA
MPKGKRIVLASRPVGEPKLSDFRAEDYEAPTPGQGEVLLRTIWLSLDPYMRGRMSDAASYAQPVPIGGVMEGGTVCEVIASNNPAYAKGDIVLARAGWQTHAQSLAQNRSGTGADFDGGRRARHARHDCLHRAPRDRQAAAR